MLDVAAVRADFPALHQSVHGKPLVYLDSAASAQRPQAVLDAMDHYHRHDHANVHRGVHTLSQRATDAFENAREKIRGYINAASVSEIIYTRGTTEAINLVAQSYGRPRFGEGDEILITQMEHHSNIVPWQLTCLQTGASLRVVPINQRGELQMDQFEQLINDNTKLVAVGHISNALGTVNPVKDIVRLAHARDLPVVVDGAQAMPHARVDVQDLGCDFYAFSGHKMFGPTGIGVLYGREALLEEMPPWQGGGEMILEVSFDRTTYAALPAKFEAGTPAIAEAVGLGAAVDYLSNIGIDAIATHERELLDYATEQLAAFDGLEIVGTAEHKASVVSFTLAGAHPHDIGTIVDNEGVAIRTGHHCAMPVMDFYGVPATARASMALYNTREDIDALVAALHRVREVMG
ncbi:MAG: cysteine desulfurase [Gammaproteobacteria bacterium]|nr:cysteine desulfurase [Gammaproteobacteria bacterium]NNM21346.1 cysteine desulfurase [Gammaproteobacteria bacterium]